MTASQIHNVYLGNVRYCLQTHSHADHLDLSHLNSRSPGYGVVGAPRLNLYASSATWQRADQTFRRDLAGYGLFDDEAERELNLKIHHVQPFEPFVVGAYRVLAIPANHAPGFGAFLYAVESHGCSMFYGTDTAELFDDAWQAFHANKLKFDLVVLDHTYGPDEPGSDHLCARQVAEHARRMRDEGLLKESGRVYATHIAHEGNPVHAELEEFARRHGYEIAYDGLVIERYAD
jgi:phosphoribosyl 1,2-cyclic phosphodiesterase